MLEPPSQATTSADAAESTVVAALVTKGREYDDITVDAALTCPAILTIQAKAKPTPGAVKQRISVSLTITVQFNACKVIKPALPLNVYET